MTAVSRRFAPVGIATGLRVPLADANLDQLLNAIVRHAGRWEQAGQQVSVEDAVRRYREQDDALYEATVQIGREVADAGESDRRLIASLIHAVHEHRDWRQLRQVFHGPDDLARAHHERDIALYSTAAVVRSVAARSEAAGICFNPETVDAILRGEQTVMRAPVERTRTGKCVLAHYKCDGGHDGTYALLVAETRAAECQIVPDHRLKIVNVQKESFGEVTDDEARLEGLGSRATFAKRWLRLHGVRGQYLVGWKVWRYEFVRVAL